MPAAINVTDLTADQRRELGVRLPRQTEFTKEEMRSWALRVLASMASHSRQERDRVLKQAIKGNAV